jgi:hypothetical protein
MPHRVGRKLPLSLPRRLAGDLVHLARQGASVPLERRLELASLAAARQAAQPQPSWAAVFLKAYSLVVAARPELRRSYLSFPTPHLYEHPLGVAGVTVERRFGDEDAVFFGQLASPESLSLLDLDDRLRRFQEEPLERLGCFRRSLRLGRLPQSLRRLVWWFNLNVSGPRRVQCLGTHGFSVSEDGVTVALHPLSPRTSTLSYGPIGADGSAHVRLVYDPRVLEQGTATRCLDDLERTLQGDVLNEVRYLHSVEAA